MVKRLFFDDETFIENINDEESIVISPKNGKLFKTSKNFGKFIGKLIDNDGFLTKDLLVRAETNNDIINSLLETKVFFDDKKKLIDDIYMFKKKYQSLMTNQTPKVAYLHLTHACNFNCWYCYNANIDKNRNDELSASEWIDIFHKLKEIGVKKFVITGGEPLLRNDLYDILYKAKKEDINIELLTNGSLFDKFDILKLSDVVDKIVISLDSMEKSVFSKSREATFFDKIQTFIDILSVHAHDKLYIRSVITKDNISSIKETKEILKNRYGIKNYITSIFLPNSLEEVKLMPNIDKIIELEKTLNSEFGRNINYDLSYNLKCGASNLIIAIDKKGDMYPCQNFIGIDRFKMTNILNKNWWNEYDTSYIRNIFAGLSVDGKKKCKNCSYRYLCGGGCPAISWRVYGNLNSYLPFLCKYLKFYAKERVINASYKEVNIINEK